MDFFILLQSYDNRKRPKMSFWDLKCQKEFLEHFMFNIFTLKYIEKNVSYVIFSNK